jgi:hypothetical protein
VSDLDAAGLKVDLRPEDGQRLADPDSCSEHEEHQVGQVSTYGGLIGGQ